MGTLTLAAAEFGLSDDLALMIWLEPPKGEVAFHDRFNERSRDNIDSQILTSSPARRRGIHKGPGKPGCRLTDTPRKQWAACLRPGRAWFSPTGIIIRGDRRFGRVFQVLLTFAQIRESQPSHARSLHALHQRVPPEGTIQYQYQPASVGPYHQQGTRFLSQPERRGFHHGKRMKTPNFNRSANRGEAHSRRECWKNWWATLESNQAWVSPAELQSAAAPCSPSP